MSIQSSINQMLSSVANQQIYKGLTKGIENIKTEVGNVGTEVGNVGIEISKEKQAQIDKLEKQFGSLQEAFNAADYGQTMYQDQETMDELIKENPDDWFDESLNQVAATRVQMQQNSARRTNENIAQRLQKAKAERSQSKQEFLKNKGGKHR